jgi:hypothetical protein
MNGRSSRLDDLKRNLGSGFALALLQNLDGDVKRREMNDEVPLAVNCLELITDIQVPPLEVKMPRIALSSWLSWSVVKAAPQV